MQVRVKRELLLRSRCPRMPVAVHVRVLELLVGASDRSMLGGKSRSLR